MLQTINKKVGLDYERLKHFKASSLNFTVIFQVQEYIPQLSEYLTIISNFVVESATKFIVFLQTNVFV